MAALHNFLLSTSAARCGHLTVLHVCLLAKRGRRFHSHRPRPPVYANSKDWPDPKLARSCPTWMTDTIGILNRVLHSASSNITFTACAPSSAVSFLRVPATAAAIALPTSVDPMNASLSRPGRDDRCAVSAPAEPRISGSAIWLAPPGIRLQISRTRLAPRQRACPRPCRSSARPSQGLPWLPGSGREGLAALGSHNSLLTNVAGLFFCQWAMRAW